MRIWYTYIVKCSDNSLYTGTSTDVERRCQEHNNKKGAKYTRSRTPVKLQTFWTFDNRSLACKAESAIKKLTKMQKLQKIEEKIILDNYVNAIINGEELTSPADIQYYINHKDAIEEELQRIYIETLSTCINESKQ